MVKRRRDMNRKRINGTINPKVHTKIIEVAHKYDISISDLLENCIIRSIKELEQELEKEINEHDDEI